MNESYCKVLKLQGWDCGNGQMGCMVGVGAVVAVGEGVGMLVVAVVW